MLTPKSLFRSPLWSPFLGLKFNFCLMLQCISSTNLSNFNLNILNIRILINLFSWHYPLKHSRYIPHNIILYNNDLQQSSTRKIKLNTFIVLNILIIIHRIWFKSLNYIPFEIIKHITNFNNCLVTDKLIF